MDYSTELREKINEFKKMDIFKSDLKDIMKTSKEIDQMKIKEYNAARKGKRYELAQNLR